MMKKKAKYIVAMIIGAMIIGACSSNGQSSESIDSGGFETNHDSKGTGIQDSVFTDLSDSFTLWEIEKIDALTTDDEGRYLIQTWRDLEFLSENIGSAEAPADGHYRLVNNIEFPDRANIPDSSKDEDYAQKAGFLPIGSRGTPFSGILHGHGLSISHLVIDRPEQNNIGLFSVAANAAFKSIHLTNVNIKGDENVGGLVGDAVGDITIEHIHMTGNAIRGSRNTSGLIGSAQKANSTISITSSRIDSYSYIEGIINTGGHVGYAVNVTINIRSSYSWTTRVIGDAKVGGYIGYAHSNAVASISDSSATDFVVGNQYVGGHVGHARNGAKITVTYSQIKSSIEGDANVGGFVGSAEDNTIIKITKSYTPQRMQVYPGSNLGGFIGSANNNTTVIITGGLIFDGLAQGRTNVGWFVGVVNNSYITIKGSYALGDFTGKNNLGGFVGLVTGNDASVEIENSYVRGKLSGNVNVGSFFGSLRSNAKITTSYVRTDVSGSSDTEGLIGAISSDGTITFTQSYYKKQKNLDPASTGDPIDILDGITALEEGKLTRNKSKDNFEGFEFDSSNGNIYWTMKSGDSWPTLDWYW